MERRRPLFDCESRWRPGGPGSDAVASGRKILLALGIQAGPFALLLCYSLGMMGILTPYATGPAPVYFGSGYITRKAFWTLGFVFGLVFLVTLLGIGVPYLMLVRPL